MPPLFKEGFFVRKAAWHKDGIVLDSAPDAESGKVLAGHHFTVQRKPLYTVEHGLVPGFVGLVKHYPSDPSHPENGALLHVARDTYGVLQNDVMWDLAYKVVGEGAKLETGVTLGDTGAELAITLWLDEPTQVPGDSSPIMPFGVASWNHDGSGKGRILASSIRIECANTNAAAYDQAKRYGTVFEFTHSKNVMRNVEEAKDTIKGLRSAHSEYMKMATELAKISISQRQRELFITELVPMPVSREVVTDRVVRNIEEARSAIRSLMEGETVPEAHRFTAYGLHLAGGEFLDHVRPFKSQHSYTRRTLIKPDKAKIKLGKLIEEVVAA